MSGTQLVGGAGDALGAIGADLSVSVSFLISKEMLSAAAETQLASEELIAIVLGVAIALSAVKSLVVEEQLRRKRSAEAKSKDGPERPRAAVQQGHSFLDFSALFVSIAQRISISVSVQLLAVSVSTQQPSRFVRIIVLLSVATFFVFVESQASRRLF